MNDDRAEAADGAGDPTGSAPGWSSWSDWMGDAIVLARRTSALVGQIQSDWESLSERDSPWTTDTIMNEVVNSWERFTPALGELVQHWVEGASQVLRDTWPDVGSDLAAWSRTLDDTPMGEASKQYTTLGSDAADRMVRGDFASADAVETFAVLGGIWAKDVWRLMAQGRAAGREADEGGGPHEPNPERAGP